MIKVTIGELGFTILASPSPIFDWNGKPKGFAIFEVDSEKRPLNYLDTITTFMGEKILVRKHYAVRGFKAIQEAQDFLSTFEVGKSVVRLKNDLRNG